MSERERQGHFFDAGGLEQHAPGELQPLLAQPRAWRAAELAREQPLQLPPRDAHAVGEGAAAVGAGRAPGAERF